MPSLSRLLQVLGLAGLQCLYLAHVQSLVVVELSHSHSHSIVGTPRGRHWQHPLYQQHPNFRHVGIQTQRWKPTPFWGQERPAASTTAILAASVNNDENTSSRSLKEILKELTDRGIVFSPLASKDELEGLLLEQEGVEPAKTSEPSPIFQSSPPPPTMDSSEGREMDARGERQRQTQRNRKIEERISKRANRKGLGGGGGEKTDAPASSRQRQRRREARRRDARGGIGDDFIEDDYDDYGDDGTAPESRRPLPNRRLQRRRRRQRLEEESPSLLGSISNTVRDSGVVDMGARASRVALKKTGKLWKDLVEFTYDGDEEEEGGYDEYGENSERRYRSNRRSRREKRRSGFNWQQPEQRSPREGRRRRPSRTESPGPDFEIPTVEYYYSDESEAVARRKESWKPQEGIPQRDARQRRQQQEAPYEVRSKTAPTASTSAPSDREESRRLESQRGKLPIGQILAALDERQIPYSPRATRKELEDLLLDVLGDNDVVAVKKAEEDNLQVIEVESISPEEWKKQQEEKLALKEQEEQKKQQQQQQQQANANSSINETSKPGQEPPKGGTAPTDSTTKFYRSVNNSYRPSGFSSPRQGRRRPPRPEPKQRTTAATTTPSTPQSPSSKNPSISNSTPASEAMGTKSTVRDAEASQGTKDEPVPPSQTGRRIYSPFGGQRPESTRKDSQSTRSTRQRRRKNDSGEIRDDFDRFGDVVEDDLGRFGDFLADSVDNILWGHGNEDKEAPRSSQGDPEDEDEESFTRRNRKRHWKDRAEERLDKVLGVHRVGGKTYDRWTEQDAAEDDEEYDILDYTRGRKRPRKKRKAFWEEDESIVSVLLGHNWDDSRPPQRSLRSNLDDIFGAFGSSRTLTALLRNLLVMAAKITGILTDWASVRDTIPRPIVFLGAAGTGFVSRPGQRIKNTLFALLSIRVLGEWISHPDPRYPRNRSSRSPRVPRSRKEPEADEAAGE